MAAAPEPAAPLDGIDIVELADGVGGGYATKLLVDAGARVLLVEPPGGDPFRRRRAEPTGVGVADAGGGAGATEDGDGLLFRFLAAGKHSVTVDPDDPAAVDALIETVARVDAVLWSAGSALASVAALRPEALRERAPDTIIVALSPFGLQGPWAGRAATEFTVQALSGGIAHRGPVEDPPLCVGGQHGDWVVGTFAAAGLLGRAEQAVEDGDRELVDVSMLEALVMTPHFNAITHQSISGQPYFVGRRPRYPADIEPTKDGWVGFALVNTLQPWLDFCALIGKPEWAEDEELHNPTLRAGRYHELIGDIRAWTTAHTTAEIVEVASALRIPVAPVGNGANLATMDHFAERGFFQRSADGTFLAPSPPLRFASALPAPVAAPAPSVGKSLRSVVWPPPRSGESTSNRPPPGESTSNRRHTVGGIAVEAPPSGAGEAAVGGFAAGELPLAGVRVCDLTAFWAGPFASHLPAMLGAEVIHVESAARLDGARSITVRTADPAQWWEWSHAFQGVNTDKLGVSLDCSTEAGLDALRRIIAQCDVVIENYSPRVLDSWGLDEAGLRAIRDDLVIVRMPAFGLAGPWRDRVGFAMTMEQISGLAWATGFADGPPVTLLGPCDPVGGVHGTIAVLLALQERRRTGRGVSVEVPMVAGALNHAAEQIIEHSAHGVLLGRHGNRSPQHAPQNLYRCADPPVAGGEPRYVAISVADDQHWQALRRAVGNPAWATSSDLDHLDGRQAAHDELDRRLADWCATRSSQEIVATLWPAGVAVAPVLTTGELIDIEQLHARTFLETVEHPVTGTSVHTTYPVQFSGGPSRWHRRAAPTVGQDTADVLRRVAGLDEGELAALDAAGVTRTVAPAR